MIGSCQQTCRLSTCPAWLQASLTDIEQRVQSLSPQRLQSETSDSFADRAENYYRKRPQLLALLADLHKSYLLLADRYTQSLLPKHLLFIHRSPSVSTDPDFDSHSDADSSLSYQHLPNCAENVADPIAVSLVMALVEKEVLAVLASDADRRRRELSRKAELQGSLLDVLEAERIVLVAENSRLAFRAAESEEAARALAAEGAYVREKAAELARRVTGMREERRVEGLERRLLGLERRSAERHETAARRGREEIERLRVENARLRSVGDRQGGRPWAKRWSCFGDPTIGCL